MSTDGQDTKCRRKIAQNFNRQTRAHERYRQIDRRQTNGRQRGFTFAKNPISKPNSALICRMQLKLWPFFWDLLPILAKIWLPWQRNLDLVIRNVFFRLVCTTKAPVISHHILVISHRNADITVFVLKFVTMVTSLYPLCTGAWQMNFRIAGSISETQTLHWHVTYNGSYGYFRFLPILAKFWLPWQRPLGPCNQKCLTWIGRPRKLS